MLPPSLIKMDIRYAHDGPGLSTYPGGQMEFPVPVEAEDGVEVAGGAVEEILPVIQGVGVADLQET